MKKKKRNIGVIIGNLEALHAYELARGMSQAAKDYEVNLLVFPGMHSGSFYDKSLLKHREEFDYQFNTVYDYVAKENIDILLISIGTVIDFLGTENYQNFLAKYENIPSIILEDNIEGKICVTLENRVGLYECIKHLIVDHHYKKIAFVSGRKNNFDAKERLSVYRKIMREYHLPIEEGMIAYGDFTEYSDELVAGILDRHPDIEAICFANDNMVLGGYRECERRGIIVGKDIGITGFDDNQQAISYDPPLTTVRVRPYIMGYQAVTKAIRMLNGETVNSAIMDSAVCIRNSCGCKSHTYNKIGLRIDQNMTLEQCICEHTAIVIHEITNYPEGEIIEQKIGSKIKRLMTILIRTYFGEKIDNFSEEVITIVKELLGKKYTGYYIIEKFQFVLLRFIQGVIKETDNITLKRQFADLSSRIFAAISTYTQGEYQRTIKRCKKEAWYATYITRDTMVYSADVKEALYQIVEKMKLLRFRSAYIYVFKEPIKNYDNRYWVCPEKMYLAAKVDRNGVKAYEVEERPYITLADGIEGGIGKEERFIAMHFVLFSNETQYGLLVCEADLQEASYAYSISLQIGTSLKFLEMMNEQMQMQKKLQDSLETISRKNELLNHISISDELTGLLNRRGVFEAMLNKLLDNPGRLVAIVFADMDNLKQINDTFGHNEGDFALRCIADILKNSFREQDPIGRIGGDEFIAYAVIDGPNLIHSIRSKIENLTEELNAKCQKPYYIEMSVGVKEVISHQRMDLKDILKEADNVLYEDKKNKRVTCIKTDNRKEDPA